MFNPVFTDPDNSLLKDRLARIQQSLRSLSFPTREEYQAEVYSEVNSVLSLGNAMSRLDPIALEGPALVGDLSLNTSILNQDAEDIAKEILRIEGQAGQLYNLAAASQNSLRQAIREQIYAPNSKRYIEAFLNDKNIASKSASVDFNAGLATLPLISEIELQPVISIGPNSIGVLGVGADALSDDKVETAMVWNGSLLELIFTLPSAQIVNRLRLELDTYDGLDIVAFTSSPDGTLVEDVLVDLGMQDVLLNGTSGKFSGDIILDFPPRHAKQVRLVIQDVVGESKIAFRSAGLFSRAYGSNAVVASSPIYAPTGSVKFVASQLEFLPFTSITHQISYNGISYVAITPGDTIKISSSPFWYRANLDRSTDQFTNLQNPLTGSGLDPAAGGSGYTLRSTGAIPLGNGILERTLVFDDISGPVDIRETPLPGTLQVQEGAVILAATDYAFSGNILSFSTPKTGIIITYQTTALGTAALQEREGYYSPLLYEFRFETQ